MEEGALVRRWTEEGGAVVRVRVSAPPANLLADAVVRELLEALEGIPPDAMVVVLDSEGSHFSYGADVREHVPGHARESLALFHALVRRLVAVEVPVVAVVRGRCLGGGLEVAACCDVVFAASDAQLGLPEVKLGVFAPVGSVVLRERIGDGAARDLLLSGRTVRADEAHALGLVQHVHGDPEASALAWIRTHLLLLSPTGLRHATRAARLPFVRRALPLLEDMEAHYVSEVLQEPDVSEGVAAFLGKRLPHWGARP